jgi:hypothetical protein
MNAYVRDLAIVAFFAMALSPATSLAQTSSPAPGTTDVWPAPPPVAASTSATPTPQPPALPPAPSNYPPPGATPAPGYYPPPGYPMALPDGQRPGYHQHDGFYLRLTVGGGYLHTSVKFQTSPEQGASLTLSGYGPVMNLALGGVVARNLIVFCQYSSSSAISPRKEQVGDVDRIENNREVKFLNFGPGVAYYFDSLELYLSGAVTLAWMNQDSGSTGKIRESDRITDKGLGTSLMVGKEWWVSRNWGLGMASMFQMASMKSNKIDAHWFTTSLSLLFSATFN